MFTNTTVTVVQSHPSTTVQSPAGHRSRQLELAHLAALLNAPPAASDLFNFKNMLLLLLLLLLLMMMMMVEARGGRVPHAVYEFFSRFRVSVLWCGVLYLEGNSEQSCLVHGACIIGGTGWHYVQ